MPRHIQHLAAVRVQDQVSLRGNFGLFASMLRRLLTVRFRQSSKPERQTA